MAKVGDYLISDIYQGGLSAFKALPTSNYFKTGSFGMTTDPRNANILQEVSAKLSSGAKQIEIEGVTSEMFESIPQPHFKEINRLAKLTGINVSVHGPVIDTAGIDRNSGFSELNREAAERKVLQTLERSHELNPDGNIPVNFHSAEGFGGSQFIPGGDGKAKRLIVVNRETGRMIPLEEEKHFYPHMEKLRPEIEERIKRGEITQKEIIEAGEREKYFQEVPIEKGQVLSPEQRLGMLNRTEWDNSLSQLIFNKERADEILEQNKVFIQHILPKLGKEYNVEDLPAPQQNAYRHYRNAMAYLEDLHDQISTKFSKAYEFGSDDQKKLLTQSAEQFKKDLDVDPSPFGQSQAMDNLLHNLKRRDLAPQMHVPIEEFAVDQSSKTYGNAAFESYKQFKDEAPILNIENPPAGFALSTGEDLKNLIEASRNQFVKRAVDSGELSEGKAIEMSKKLIGATWDVGHINMLRKFGYSEKDIIKETEKIAPYLKHIHLSDNFGFEHTELPMGMGNVPIKEIMASLKKAGVKTEDMPKIIEAGQWWQFFKTSPLQPTMEYMGSPVYSTAAAPYWNQVPGLYQGYMGGLSGPWLPQVNYETFGTNFSQLPSELGGQRPGAGNRMSGRNME